MEKSLKSIATNHGLYLGIALSLWTILGYAIDLSLLVNFWINLLVIPLVIIATGIFVIGKCKSVSKGFISFKGAFTSFFITVLVGIVVSSLVSILLFNFIDPDAALAIKEMAIEKTVTMMEGFGAPADKIDEQVEAIEAQNLFSIKTQLFQLGQGLVFFIIIGLIAAAIMKKSDPDAE
ncbi:DUF4199 domain-containing protein [Tamlana sp. 2201CG12-4]|uniref:DUF4199 domain-containing protein n=1 Tax=Tamlana sp. 2201CG12-4 TaxID=3112582 RepID=UPI002DB6786D|nr:DUF4199 domain-containing protein [Tamlana sp. 2201CG12-4]MEC3908353.1 DUF4199 domain-containing protein [Tamlana sp. 2201CG12-4]